MFGPLFDNFSIFSRKMRKQMMPALLYAKRTFQTQEHSCTMEAKIVGRGLILETGLLLE